MKLWIEILKLAASGDSKAARDMLYFDLPLALRYPASYSSENLDYRGPLADSVSAFIARLPQSERGMALSRKSDLVDYALDCIKTTIERSVLLLEFCIENPGLSLDQIAEEFDDWLGLRRSFEHRRKLIADNLRSMLNAGIELPQTIITALGDEREARYEFNETALARKWDMALAWKDFKEQQELDSSYLCIDDSDTNEDPATDAETVDFGMVTMADIVIGSGTMPDRETLFDLRRRGKELGPEITNLMEQMHESRPRDGYRPIAWHNVFWNIPSEYEALRIALETRDPLCDTDQSLADHIAGNYSDVTKPNRLNVFRRRDALYKACKSMIIDRLRKWREMNKQQSESHM